MSFQSPQDSEPDEKNSILSTIIGTIIGGVFFILTAIWVAQYLGASPEIRLIKSALNSVGVGGSDRDCAAVESYMKDLTPIYNGLARDMTTSQSAVEFESAAFYWYNQTQDLTPAKDVDTFHALNLAFMSFMSNGFVDTIQRAGSDDEAFVRITSTYSNPIDKEFQKIAQDCPQEVRELERVFESFGTFPRRSNTAYHDHDGVHPSERVLRSVQGQWVTHM